VLVGVDASRITRPRRTGTENYSLHVLRSLLALDSSNTYRLYTSAPVSDDLLPSNPRVSTRLIRLPRLWTQLGLSREMLTSPPDVLFVPTHVLPLMLPKHSLVVVYDVGHRFFPRAHTLTEWLYTEWAIRRHVRVATRLLTISEASKRDLVRLYRADAARIDVAYPAVEARFKPAPNEEIARVRTEYGLGQRYVLHLGTIKPRKNLPRLVRAFARADIPRETQLVLGGMTTFGATAVEQAIRETNTQHRVKRLAYVPDADLPALYGGAACVAVVSLYEGFGMPALEALACGAPLLASNRGSLPEIADGAAVLVDPLDEASIAHGLENATQVGDPRDERRQRGLARAAEFTWARAAGVTQRALEQAYRQDVGTPIPSASPFAAS
jgi:glycosyltransferase involved in cell wall biosynthesis